MSTEWTYLVPLDGNTARGRRKPKPSLRLAFEPLQCSLVLFQVRRKHFPAALIMLLYTGNTTVRQLMLTIRGK